MTEAALLELKTVGTEVKLRIKEHEDMLQNYSASIRMNEMVKANEYYEKILEINKHIDTLLEKIRTLELKIKNKHGNIDTGLFHTAVFHTDDLSDVTRKIKKDEEKIHKLKSNLKNIKGVNASAAIETRSERTKYIFMWILMVIVVMLTIRAFMYEPSTIDTIFLVAALFLGVFHFFNKQV
jgi:cell division protein ZapA (FtsZ GTPase activity inhibitor)|tara:strand:+ start:1378 stop:1920 length:543 start_codon:yes stop_codon:yes gene_type:complete